MVQWDTVKILYFTNLEKILYLLVNSNITIHEFLLLKSISKYSRNYINNEISKINIIGHFRKTFIKLSCHNCDCKAMSPTYHEINQ